MWLHIVVLNKSNHRWRCWKGSIKQFVGPLFIELGYLQVFAHTKLNWRNIVVQVLRTQRRSNPPMQEVVNKEIIQHLYTCMVYQNSNSDRVSRVQCVTKKLMYVSLQYFRYISLKSCVSRSILYLFLCAFLMFSRNMFRRGNTETHLKEVHKRASIEVIYGQ